MPTLRPALVLVGCLLLCTCTEDSPTESGTDPDPVVPPAFLVGYTTDDARAVSATIAASTGGSLAATDAAGASFSLTIPPEALDSNTMITITPLSCLTIGGPGATRCSDDDTTSGRCCLTGALFEPSGLIFNEPATVEISYSGEFPFRRNGTMIWFDSTESAFLPCSTLVDTISGSLTAHLHHFSGYGAAAPDSAQWWALYQYWSNELRASVGNTREFLTALQGLLDLAAMNWQIDMFGEVEPICTGLFEAIETTTSERVRAHHAALRAMVEQSWEKGLVYDLIAFHQMLGEFENRLSADFWYACTQTRVWIIGTIEMLVQHHAEAGHAQCEADNCDGRQDLQWAFDVCMTGYVEDVPMVSQIRNWLEDCCGELNVEISVTPETLHRAGLAQDDTYGTYATVTVTVTSQSGEPQEGVAVVVKWSKNISNLCTGETDANGQFVGYFSAHLPGTAYNGHDFLEYMVWAEASWVGGSYRSEDVPVDFQNVVVSASYSYSYNAEYDNGQIMTVTDCSVNGSFEMPAGGCATGDCGTVTRSYHHSRGNYSIDLIDLATRDLWNGSAGFTYQQITVGNGQTLTTQYVTGVSIASPCIIFERVVLQACEPDPTGCVSDTSDIPACGDMDLCIRYPNICDGVYIQHDGFGGYETWLWTYDDEYITALWSIDVSAGYR